MADVILLLGGNEEGTHEVIKQVPGFLNEFIGEVISLSGLYTSPPWGFEHPHWFLNQVIILKSEMAPVELLKETQRIEKQLGRKRKTRSASYEARLIDIDILFIDEQIIDQPELQIPHPRLHLRKFTLQPLNELVPGLLHPVLQKSVSQLLTECPDEADVRRLDQSFGP